jgi:indole-3-acetate monooxygenase
MRWSTRDSSACSYRGVLGGLEVDVVTGFEAMEAVSRIDSAAGWTLQIAAAPVGLAALFPDTTAREVYGHANSVVAGGFSPPGAVQAVEGGFRLNGRWSFVSGCQRATWIVNPAVEIKDGAPVLTDDGHPLVRVCVYPAAEAEIIDTWHSMGMRGTGSHDVAANNVFVPAERTAIFRPFSIDPGPAFTGPFAKMGMMPTTLGNAVVALGIARAAIDESIGIVRTKTPAHFQTPPGQRSTVQGHLGRAEATLSAARAYFYESLRTAWAVAESESSIGTKERMNLQLAASYAAESAANTVDFVHAAVGSTGVLEAQYAFARHFRDVHTITQHALCSATRFESMGQVMLGMKPTGLFSAFSATTGANEPFRG